MEDMIIVIQIFSDASERICWKSIHASYTVVCHKREIGGGEGGMHWMYVFVSVDLNVWEH